MTLWFSGKEMQRGKLLSDFVGKNEKTKIIVKIQKVRKTLYSYSKFLFYSFRKVMLHQLGNVSYPKKNKNK
jgi:hypothetical protein